MVIDQGSSGATTKSWIKMIAFVSLVAAAICISLRQRCAETSEPIYEGQQLSALVERTVLKCDNKAGQVLKRTIVSVDNPERMVIQKELAVCAVKALNTQDYPGLRKVYSLFLSHCSAPVCKMLPVWRTPSPQDRSCALLWIWSWPLDPFYPQSMEPYQQLQPILCKIAQASSTTMPDRQLAVRALAHFNTFSPEICQIMLGALSNHADQIEQFVSKDVIQWCGKFTPAPERAVPILVEGLAVDDNSLKNDCADALKAYGSRARFMVEALLALAKTNHWPTASSAAWALKGIDPETASRMGIN